MYSKILCRHRWLGVGKIFYDFLEKIFKGVYFETTFLLLAQMNFLKLLNRSSWNFHYIFLTMSFLIFLIYVLDLKQEKMFFFCCKKQWKKRFFEEFPPFWNFCMNFFVWGSEYSYCCTKYKTLCFICFRWSFM